MRCQTQPFGYARVPNYLDGEKSNAQQSSEASLSEATKLEAMFSHRGYGSMITLKQAHSLNILFTWRLCIYLLRQLGVWHLFASSSKRCWHPDARTR